RVDLDAGVDDGVLADEALVAQHDALLAPAPPPQVARPADDRAPQPHRRAQIGVVVDHAAMDIGVGPDPNVGAEHGGLPQMGPRFDPAIVADDDRSLEAGAGVDFGPLPQPLPFANPETGDLEVDLAVEHVLMGLAVG